MSEINPVTDGTLENLDGALAPTDFKPRNIVVRAVSKTWNNVHLWRAVTLVVILILGINVAMVQPLRNIYSLTDPDTNGFVAPRNMGAIIDDLDASVVTVYCEAKGKDGTQGTGWAFEFPDALEKGTTALMTNHHVIKDCMSGGTITLEDFWGETFRAEIERFDMYNDLAVLSTNHTIPALNLAGYPPVNGFWVLAYGTADGYVGSVATGNIINLDEYGDLLISANISGGNSGGPLVDNEGNVFGVNTFAANNEENNTQYNISVSLDSFCQRILDCEGDTYWDWSYGQ